MADIFNPTTGHSFFKVSDELAAILFDLNLVRYVSKQKATRPTEYAVVKHESTQNSADVPDRWVIVRRSFRSADMPAEELIYGGTPDGALQAFRDIPVEIVEEYRRALAGQPLYRGPDTADAESARKRQNAMGATTSGHTLNLPLPGGEK